MLKRILPLVALLALLGGCANYRLGDGNKPLYHTIAFAPVVNRSYAPQLQALVSDAMFRNFAQNGGMAVAAKETDAEVVLYITVDEFHKMMGASNSLDTGRARSVVLALKARATLMNPATKQVIYDDAIEVTEEVYADSGMDRAENEGMPQLAELLAKKVYKAVVSNW